MADATASRDTVGASAARVEEVLAQMTLEEKAALTVGRDSWTTQPIRAVRRPVRLGLRRPHRPAQGRQRRGYEPGPQSPRDLFSHRIGAGRLLEESTKKLFMPCRDTTARSNRVAGGCGMILAR